MTGDTLRVGNSFIERSLAITMAAQPLAWFEASGLPEEAFGIAPLVSSYKEMMADLHSGVILPIHPSVQEQLRSLPLPADIKFPLKVVSDHLFTIFAQNHSV